MSAGFNALRIPATGTHTATVIWLHGLGDSGHGWGFIAKYLDFPNVKYVLPHASNIPITINGGMRMPGWYDVKSLSDWNASQDEGNMLKTVQLVHKLITEEVDSGIPSERIIVGGFSQGCAMAILSAYTCERKLGGVVGLSGWLPLHQKFAAMMSDANKKTPMFQGHGDADMVVNYKLGETTAEALRKLGITVDFHTFPDMGHEADPEELNLVRDWMTERLTIHSKVGDPTDKPRGEPSKEPKESKG